MTLKINSKCFTFAHKVILLKAKQKGEKAKQKLVYFSMNMAWIEWIA